MIIKLDMLLHDFAAFIQSDAMKPTGIYQQYLPSYCYNDLGKNLGDEVGRAGECRICWEGKKFREGIQLVRLMKAETATVGESSVMKVTLEIPEIHHLVMDKGSVCVRVPMETLCSLMRHLQSYSRFPSQESTKTDRVWLHF